MRQTSAEHSGGIFSKTWAILAIVAVYLSRAQASETSLFENQLNVLQNWQILKPEASDTLIREFGDYYNARGQEFERCMELRNDAARCNGSLKPQRHKTSEQHCQNAEAKRSKMETTELNQCSLFVSQLEKNMRPVNLNMDYSKQCHSNADGNMVCEESQSFSTTPRK